MNGTPRLRSAFPQTPRSSPRQDGTPRSTASTSASVRSSSKLNTSLPDINPPRNQTISGGPLIPFDTIDAPQQRLYIVAIYIALLTWKIYDFHHLQEEQTESLWKFMKWVAIDGVSLFGLPELRIPWLEWSSPTMVCIFLAHAFLDAILMFRIPIPLGAGLLAFSRFFYDRELAISERHVKQSSVLHNASLILGKQIVHILPEGSAALNPARDSFCLDSASPHVALPIQLNQTFPIEMQLLHVDLDTNINDTIRIPSSQIKKMMKEAQARAATTFDSPIVLNYVVKKPGLYYLQKVVDESKLEVRRRRHPDTLVVACPRAIVKPLGAHKCKGELSDVVLEVTGTPPLKVKYRKLVNGVEQEANLQSIQPDDFSSPLVQQESKSLVLRNRADLSWARSQTVQVPLSELLGVSGKWVYVMDQVQDALGNVVDYSQKDHDKQEKAVTSSPHLHQLINVHERPTVFIDGCNTRQPLRVARGHEVHLPLSMGSTGKGGFIDGPYHLVYSLTEETEASEDQTTPSKLIRAELKNAHQRPVIRTPGLYTLQSVSTEFCSGELLEPASCLLQNPQEPSVRLETEEIFDKCAHKAIGLRVDLHLTGSPPFEVRYVLERSDGQKSPPQSVIVQGLRGQVELTPPTEGHYTYRFTEINDATYKGYSLAHQNLVLEQDVKPSAHAHFVMAQKKQEICIDQAVSFTVGLRGEGPFGVEYWLVHGNQRKAFKVSDIEGYSFDITTDRLTKGGDYTLALASVTDRLGCREFLQEEAKITVRHQKPKAGFGQIENARSLKTLEHRQVALPVRLSGEPPWTVTYGNVGNPEHIYQVDLRSPNDQINVQQQGTYELISVKDRICSGAVDSSARKFDVHWISRPSLRVAHSSYKGQTSNTFFKHDVCEGQEDAADLHFDGEPPFAVKYTEHYQPDEGSKDRKQKSPRNKSLNPGLHMASVLMDTSQAGLMTYKFTELADAHYDHDQKQFNPFSIEQRVHPRPSVAFANPGKTYSYCSVEAAGEEVIPIQLTGQAPFTVDVEIKHHGTARPDLVTISDISSASHDLVIPHSRLHLGTSAISLRKVSDSRGCSRLLDSTQPRVQISVHDAPSISPLDTQEGFCVGDRISFTLSGQPPFQVFYEFNGVARKATSTSTTFRRLAEKPGRFQITGVSDSASNCRASNSITRHIHGMPSVRVSHGRESVVDIHEGGEAEITFEFEGTPPFEFTWTRSTNSKKGHKSTVLEMRSETSNEHSMTVRASEEGTYEVVAIRDAHCSYAREGIDVGKKQKLLTF